MSDYVSTVTLEQVAGQLSRAKSVIIVTHAKPDGDAFGSVVAMTLALRAMGKRVEPWFMPPLPLPLKALPLAQVVPMWSAASTLGEAERCLILDTGAWSQLSPMRAVLEPRLPQTLILDHHLTGDVEAAGRYIDPTAASCCEVVAEVLEAMTHQAQELDPWPPGVAEALFIGVASDTGWFRFSNTTPRTHRLAARLQASGVNPAQLYAQLEQGERPQKLALMSRALHNLELLADGRVALMWLRAEDFSLSGAMLEETERLVDLPQVVASVQVVVLITESRSGRNEPIRLSFRSKPTVDAVNVAALAARFGGGGHARAAGAKVQAPFESVYEQVKQAVASLSLASVPD